jgi:hypothetical protein
VGESLHEQQVGSENERNHGFNNQMLSTHTHENLSVRSTAAFVGNEKKSLSYHFTTRAPSLIYSVPADA